MQVTSIFSFSHNVFYSITDRNYLLCYIYFVVCKCLHCGQGRIFVTWEWVKTASQLYKNALLLMSNNVFGNFTFLNNLFSEKAGKSSQFCPIILDYLSVQSRYRRVTNMSELTIKIQTK